jgi:DNA-binding NarL/FixJ family response regulator
MKIIIVDDHTLFREGLAAIIQQEPDIEVIALVGTVGEAIDAVQKIPPDIVLMDFNLPDGTGVEATKKILQNNPACKIVFMTMSDSDEDLLAAVRSGAVGYLMKNINPANLVTSLRAVQSGESALSGVMTLKVMRALASSRETDPLIDPRLEKLTRREKDILSELTLGKSNQEIAHKLYISENTVKYHVHSILEKLNLQDRKEVAKLFKAHRAE